MAEYLTAALPGTGGEIRAVAADFFVEELPRNTNGKVLKRDLAERLPAIAGR